MDKEKAPIDSSLEDLLEAGKQAFAAGDRRAAHELWRTAAVANPYDERVWASLLQVLRREDDRQVCLENIISINPLNTDARRQLRGLKRKRRLREEARNTATIALAAQTPSDRTANAGAGDPGWDRHRRGGGFAGCGGKRRRLQRFPLDQSALIFAINADVL